MASNPGNLEPGDGPDPPGSGALVLVRRAGELRSVGRSLRRRVGDIDDGGFAQRGQPRLDHRRGDLRGQGGLGLPSPGGFDPLARCPPGPEHQQQGSVVPRQGSLSDLIESPGVILLDEDRRSPFRLRVPASPERRRERQGVRPLGQTLAVPPERLPLNPKLPLILFHPDPPRPGWLPHRGAPLEFEWEKCLKARGPASSSRVRSAISERNRPRTSRDRGFRRDQRATSPISTIGLLAF